MRYKTIRRQRPIAGGREQLPSCVIKEIRKAVEKDAMKYGVSKSFVIAVILARAYGIRKQEDFLVKIKEEEDTPLVKLVK